ncbi:hypothetical protein ES708_21582 [subsurface metagenome]
MSAYYERGVIDKYPGAGVIIPGDLGAEDCAKWTSLQALVLALTSGETGVTPTTIIGGLAYTEAAIGELDTECLII